MYHYILLFINKVLYYIRIPFYTLKILFVILWLWFCDWWIKPPPSPSEGRGVPMRTREDKDSWLFSQIFFCKILANLSPPPPSGRSGGASVYLSVKQTVTKVFAELVTPVPQKTIAFWIKLLTFANRKEKASPTAPPDLPEPTVTDRREVKGRSADREIAPKSFRS